jgi:hypothetical protein
MDPQAQIHRDTNDGDVDAESNNCIDPQTLQSSKDESIPAKKNWRAYLF